MCKINNTHCIEKKVKAMKKVPTHIPRTMYVAYMKFKIMRLHLHRINIDKNFVVCIRQPKVHYY